MKKWFKAWLIFDAILGVAFCFYLGRDGLMSIGCVILDPDGEVYIECDEDLKNEIDSD